MANNESSIPRPECMAGVDNRSRIVALEKSDEHVWTAIDDIRSRLDRLPSWGVALVSALSAVAGAAVAIAVSFAVELAKN
jgi:anti-sigma-K factor RskA